MSDKIDAVIASMGWDLDQQEWADMRRLCEAALAQQPAPALPEEGDPDNAPWMSADTDPAIAWRDGWDACRDAMLAVTPAAPVAQEPVAWINHETLTNSASVDFGRYYLSPVRTDEDDTPLYTAPPAAEQPDTVAVPRELLEQLVDVADASECYDPAERGWALLTGGEK